MGPPFGDTLVISCYPTRLKFLILSYSFNEQDQNNLLRKWKVPPWNERIHFKNEISPSLWDGKFIGTNMAPEYTRKFFASLFKFHGVT